MDDIKQMVALTALNEMMQSRRFDICTIRSVAEMLRVIPGGDAYAVLAPLHCIEYSKMPAELREAIPGLIQQVLGVAPAYQFKTLAPLITVTQTQNKGVLHRLGLA